MQTESPNEEELNFKYGTRYFKILDTKVENGKTIIVKKHLKTAHPNHAYYVEPIPRQKLSHYIKTFYWQSFKLGILTHEEFLKGVDIANRYDELYSQCIEEIEQFELYWKTLKDSILELYHQKNFNNDDLYNQFVFNYLQCPPEYYREDNHFSHKYGQFDFNLSKLPNYFTEDYFEITTKDLWDKTEEEEEHLVEQLNEVGKDKIWNEFEDFDNFYNYKPTKTIRNESLLRGHWFKLPPGWSLIDISPVIDETKWGGKLWKDGRPFEWGIRENEQLEKEFENIYEQALRDYLASHYPKNTLYPLPYPIEKQKIADLEECSQFRRWYGEDNINDVNSNDLIISNNSEETLSSLKQNFENAVRHKLNEDAEYGFLKTLCSYWNITHLNEQGKITSEIDDWWWYASSYLWANFPPLYWGYMDVLNELQIKYVPLFY